MPRIGIIADTHGLLRPQAVTALHGCDAIIHAGDVGKPEVLQSLGNVAPVTAIRGNVDVGDWATDLPDRRQADVCGVSVYLIHDLKALGDGAPDGIDAIVCGHSHQPRIAECEGVLVFNPGSAGPRRFRLPVTLGLLHVDDGHLRPELVTLDV